MNWEEAKQNTLNLWRSIYDSVGEADPVSLLTEINVISDLCALAKEESNAAHDLVKCHYCPAYQQFGGCSQVSGLLSELVARRDWAELRVQIAAFIQQLERMEAPGPLQAVVH